MNTKNSKTSYPHELLHKLTDKINLRKGWKCVASTWNDEFDLPNRSYFVIRCWRLLWVYYYDIIIILLYIYLDR